MTATYKLKLQVAEHPDEHTRTEVLTNLHLLTCVVVIASSQSFLQLLIVDIPFVVVGQHLKCLCIQGRFAACEHQADNT